MTTLLNTISGLATSNTQKGQLAALEKAFNTGCEDLTSTVSSLNTATVAIQNTTHAINQQLCDYATALAPVTQNSLLIAKNAMPGLNKMASKMKYINAILNPISILLTVSDCTDPESKSVASAAADAAKTQSNSLASENAKEVNSLIESFVNTTSTGYLPLDPLYQAVTAASQALDASVVSDLQNQFDSLSAHLQALTQSLVSNYSYSSGGTTYETQFLSGANITAMNTLLNDLSNNT